MKNDDLARERRTLLFEPNVHGHRLYYVSLLVRHLLEQDADVHLLTRAGATESTEWGLHLGSAPGIHVHEADAPTMSELETLSSRLGATLVLVPDGDHELIGLVRRGWRGTGELSVLIMRPDAQGDWSARALLWGAAKKALVFVADRRRRVRVSALRSAMSRRTFPIRWVADPVTLECSADDLVSARALLATPEPLYWVGIFGAISPRKNVNLVAEAVRAVPGTALLVAGSFDQAARAEAQTALQALRNEGRVVRLISENLTSPVFDSLISSVDCVAAIHSNEGPSGVVGKAAAANRALLLGGARSLRRDARSIGAGALWSRLDADRIADNLRALMTSGLRTSVSTTSAAEFARKLL